MTNTYVGVILLLQRMNEYQPVIINGRPQLTSGVMVTHERRMAPGPTLGVSHRALTLPCPLILPPSPEQPLMVLVLPQRCFVPSAVGVGSMEHAAFSDWLGQAGLSSLIPVSPLLFPPGYPHYQLLSIRESKGQPELFSSPTRR